MIYRPRLVDGYESAQFMDDDHGNMFLIENQGKSLIEDWRPMRVRLFTTRRDWRPADFPSLSFHSLLMRRSALEVMEDLLVDHGEILPMVPYRGVELFLFHVTRVIDALDVEHSTLSCFDDGRIWDINAPAFFEPLVRDAVLFKLPNIRASEIFVSHRFVERVQSARLTGMTFTLAWSAEGGPVPFQFL